VQRAAFRESCISGGTDAQEDKRNKEPLQASLHSMPGDKISIRLIAQQRFVEQLGYQIVEEEQ
jgi:hypothetical protein